MRFNADLPIQEIADILDIKLSAAKMRLYRAMDIFKKHYESFCLWAKPQPRLIMSKSLKRN